MDERKGRIQQIVEALPEARTIEVNRGDMKCEIKTKGFAYWLEDNMPSGQIEFVVKVQEDEQIALLAEHPQKYHQPSVKTWKKWLGIRLDVEPLDWNYIEQRLIEAYRATAPKSLSKQLEPGLQRSCELGGALLKV